MATLASEAITRCWPQAVSAAGLSQRSNYVNVDP